MKQQAKKVLVIGASIAGPAICYWLNQYGYDITLVERSRALRKGGYAIDIRGIAVEVARQMGIYQQVCQKRTSLRSGKYVDLNGKILSEEDGETAGFREGDDVEIVRGELVDILLQAVADVSPRFNTYVTQFNQQADGVAVTFNTGETELYDLVIAADGLHSSTRKQVFGESQYQMKDLGAYISVCSVPNYLQLDHAEISFERQQKHLNINSDQVPHVAQVGFMFRTERQLADFENEQTQKAFIREIYQDMGWETNHILTLMDDSDDLYFDAITQVKMSDWTHGRVALLGDAGYCASPLSGQGTSLALVGAYILAGELQAANGDHQKAFQKYNQLMRPFVDANQAFGAWVGETFLLQQEMSKEASEKRTLEIMNRLRQVANAISLPSYN